MKPVSFSAFAEADLVEIALNIARDNPAPAQSFVDELEAKCEALGAFPGMGVSRSELAVDLCMPTMSRTKADVAIGPNFRWRGRAVSIAPCSIAALAPRTPRRYVA